jgi:lipid-binding SYLF domain-containing protein
MNDVDTEQGSDMGNLFRAVWILVWLLCGPSVYADDEADYKTLLVEATSHLEKFKGHSQSEAISNIAGAAKAVVIIPDEVTGALIVGYKRGTGAVFRRHGQDWSDPVFMTFVDYSVGFQIGGTESEVIVCILTDQLADGIAEGVSKMGGGGGFALGTLGLGSQGGGSLGGGLEMISVSTKKGLQIGGNVANTRIHPADEFNMAAYGDDYDIKDILSKPGGQLEAAKTLREALVAGTKKSFWE